ncbi:hypothetical protein SADUNF_Sadunf04G0120100 [Salix dunnii]|uniref:Uncharacterized protein n=1 Tax=Salix dunnii TaxID=1413687 RepID=A0A835N2X7_9ROSI|nr:hypothetical protein SADUNF_Sadunf04G0120100 [Salix dunnii]
MSIPKTVDSTLWSDSFTAILTDLENAPLTSFLTSTLLKVNWLRRWTGMEIYLLLQSICLLLQHINSFRIFLLDFPPVEDREVQLSNAGGPKQPINEPSNGSLCSQKSSLNPFILFIVLDFLKAPWQRAFYYESILECLKSSGKMRRLLLVRNCDSNKSKYINPGSQSVCLLLLQVMEMVLYLELVVLQICGICPVLGSYGRPCILKSINHIFETHNISCLSRIVTVKHFWKNSETWLGE